MTKPTDVFFFPNGNTAVTDGTKQIPELQESWLLLFAKFLESKGVDPTTVTYHLPGGEARVFRTASDEFNWRMD